MGSQKTNTFKLKFCFVLFGSITLTYFVSLYWCLKSKLDLVPFSSHDALEKEFNDPMQFQHYVPRDHPIKESFKLEPKLNKAFIKRHQNKDVLFFNRVPKTGSEMLVLLLQWLQKVNNFKHIRLKNTVNRFLSHQEQLEFAATVGEKLNDSTERLVSFDRHLHFTNFTSIGLKMPLMINIIRDPVEKIASRFYYARATPRPGGFTPPGLAPKTLPKFTSLEECLAVKAPECSYVPGNEYDLTIPYFCGHHHYCRELGNKAALATAKRNVENWYEVVGVLEDVNSTLSVLEAYLPRFFTGASDLYYKELHGFHQNKNYQKPKEFSSWARNQLRKNLTLEYEFYNFVTSRLNFQSNHKRKIRQ